MLACLGQSCMESYVRNCGQLTGGKLLPHTDRLVDFSPASPDSEAVQFTSRLWYQNYCSYLEVPGTLFRGPPGTPLVDYALYAAQAQGKLDAKSKRASLWFGIAYR